MSKDTPEAKLGKSRCCRARTPILIRKFSWSWLWHCELTVNIWQHALYGGLNLFLTFNKTEMTGHYLSCIKKICVTFLENITHIHSSLYSAGCLSFLPYFLPSFFLTFFLSLYLFLLSSLYKLSVPFRLQSIQLMPETLVFSEIVESWIFQGIYKHKTAVNNACYIIFLVFHYRVKHFPFL